MGYFPTVHPRCTRGAGLAVLFDGQPCDDEKVSEHYRRKPLKRTCTVCTAAAPCTAVHFAACPATAPRNRGDLSAD